MKQIFKNLLPGAKANLFLWMLFLSSMQAGAVTTFTVSNLLSAGLGSLAQAVANANITPNVGGNDIIVFTVAGTIPLTADLTPTDPVTIDGYTAPGYAANIPVVNIGGTTNPFLFNNAAAAGSIVRGLIINKCTNGIQITGVNNITVTGCWIGLNTAGGLPAGATAAQKVTGFGIWISGANNNTIGGGNAAADRNIISGTALSGVRIQSSSANNIIAGNYIGTNSTGLSAIPNTNRGVEIDNSNNNIIGGTIPPSNVISGNGNHGIMLTTSTGTIIKGNYIGLGSDGNTALGNYHGIEINTTSTSNIIGGITLNDRNVIAGNLNTGIDITSNSGSCVILGNYIGTNAAGNAAKANGDHGININNALAVTIGGTVAGSGNVISGNGVGTFKRGINIDLSSHGTIIKGNYIGTNAAGTAAIANLCDGIFINASNNCTIGGSNKIERNIISGNGTLLTNSGLSIAGCNRHIIKGNFFGISANGLSAMPNFGSGLSISNSIGDSIGGMTLMERNVCSGNNINGFGIYLSNVDSSRFYGNYIGTDSTGLAALANKQHGVSAQSGSDVNYWYNNVVSGNTLEGFDFFSCIKNYLYGNFVGLGKNGTTKVSNGSNGVRIGAGSQNFIIGGNVAGQRNYVSGNDVGAGSHAFAVDGGSTNNTFKGNYMGCDITGMVAMGNTGSGIMFLDGSNGNIVGGTAPGEGNIICCSKGDLGIRIQISSNNVVYGNSIGVNAAGNMAAGFGNFLYGVLITSYSYLSQVSNNNIIGSIGAGANIIAGNGSDGVDIYNNGGTASNFNPIIGNKIYCNVGLGINHQTNSATENEGVNPPIVTSSTANAVSGTGVNGNTIHIYRNTTSGPGCDCEGEIYLGTTTVAAGVWSFTHSLNLSAAAQLSVTATQTNSTNSTSEFWVCSSPLPVTLVSFNALLKNQIVALEWSTTSEINNNYFIIERSFDGINFDSIGRVDGSGNSNALVNYNFSDANPLAGIAYYRLKQVDIDGKIRYTPVKSVTFDGSEFSVQPIPSSDFLYLKMSHLPDAKCRLSVYNTLGQLMLEEEIINQANTLNKKIDISELAVGMYVLQMVSGDNVFVRKIEKK
ncbi:MAG TPA: T9SS type A sorting domain-containing protein [Cytophagaceae bacterium]|jgi:hypothetical protein|nr:T9SS type A sorting domain-containing protein [Cytophagaceae bacterium]